MSAPESRPPEDAPSEHVTPTTAAADIPERTDVLIIGGGPAGALLSCLLTRRGIANVLVERQNDLARTFRGETVAAPSVVALRELGFGPGLDEHGFLETTDVVTIIEGRPVLRMDYGRFGDGTLPIDIPQPGLIRMFDAAAAAASNGSRHYVAGWAMQQLERDERGAVVGARLKSGTERVTVRARLVVGADGRFSKVRKDSGLTADVQPMQRDFMSFLVPRPAGWGRTAELVVHGDKHLVILPTFPDTLRVGHNLPKRGLGPLRAAGFDAFAGSIAAIDPRIGALVEQHLTGWDDCGFLEIFTAELPEWTREGLLLIGDASHTATPILGQGVNLAMQDAVVVTGVIARALAATATDGVVAAAHFDTFVAERRRHKNSVTRFQRLQESQLSASTPREMRLRRLRYRVLDALSIKYRVLDRVINARHAVDPLDRDLARVAPAVAADPLSA